MKKNSEEKTQIACIMHGGGINLEENLKRFRDVGAEIISHENHTEVFATKEQMRKLYR